MTSPVDMKGDGMEVSRRPLRPSEAETSASQSRSSSPSARLTRALDIACLYTGGMTFGEFDEGSILFADIRDLIDQHRAMLDALNRIAGHSDASVRSQTDRLQTINMIARFAIADCAAERTALPEDERDGATQQIPPTVEPK